MAACKGYITVLQVWSADHQGERFQLEQTDSETRRYLGDLPGASWIRPARLLARVNDVHVDSGSEKRIIMDKDGKWYVHPAPDVSPLLSAGLNDEDASERDFSDAYEIQK